MLPKIKIVQGIDRTADLRSRLEMLTKRQVLVGVPQTKPSGGDNTSRRERTKANNAMLAYVHDNGSPLQGIPRREFLRPGIKGAQREIAEKQRQTARAALDEGGAERIEKGLVAVGLIAQRAVRKKITDGPFSPLKAGTLRARRRRGRTGTRPLIDTGQLRNAINFAVRDKK